MLWLAAPPSLKTFPFETVHACVVFRKVQLIACNARMHATLHFIASVVTATCIYLFLRRVQEGAEMDVDTPSLSPKKKEKTAVTFACKTFDKPSDTGKEITASQTRTINPKP